MKQKILRSAESIVDNSHASIEFILAVALILYGAYVASPLHVTDCNAMFSFIFNNPIYRTITGIMITLPSWPILFFQMKNGFHDYSAKKSRKKLLLAISVVYLYISVLRVATLGVFPVYWLFTLTLGFISAILYLRLD